MKILDVPQSGSVAGVTSSRNRFGQYRRTRAMITNPNSEAQTAARGFLTELSKSWAGLTAMQRAAWRTWADTQPRNDSLGQTIFLTGFQQYVGVNSFLLNLSLAIVVDPPSYPVVGTITSIEVVAQTDNLNVNLEGTPDLPVAIWASPPVSQGRNYNNDFRYMTAGTLDEGTVSVGLTTIYTARFGALALLEGLKIFIRAIPFSDAGARGAITTGSGVITPP